MSGNGGLYKKDGQLNKNCQKYPPNVFATSQSNALTTIKNATDINNIKTNDGDNNNNICNSAVMKTTTVKTKKVSTKSNDNYKKVVTINR